MKKTAKIILTAFFILSVVVCVRGWKLNGFTPYVCLDLTESVFSYTRGGIFSGGNIDASLGAEFEIFGRNTLYALYSLEYSGPGFHPQDTTNFDERSLSHIMDLEWRFELFDFLVLKPGFNKSIVYRRFGANETWENGLYSNESVGGHLAIDYIFGFTTLTARYLFRDIGFPNYTDLFTEFQNANLSSEISAGAADQKFEEFSLGFERGKLKVRASYIAINFENQKVLLSSGLYGDTLQKDENFQSEVSLKLDFWFFKIYPTVKFAVFRSNQNYMRFKYLGASITDVTNPSGDVTFIDDNYSYDELELSVPAEIISSSGRWAILAGIDITRRVYKSRFARDELNNYKSEKQKNLITRFSAGIKKRITDITSVSLVYGFTVAGSNNKFETYQPYNYTGHSLGLNYRVEF